MSLIRSETRHRRFPVVIFAIALLATVARGVIQLFADQTAGYAVQTAAVVLFGIVLVAGGARRANRWARPAAVLVIGFIVVALVSLIASLWAHNIDYGVVYAGVMVFFAIALAFFASGDFDRVGARWIGPVVVAVTLGQVAVAVVQQVFRDRTLPGGAHVGELVRPPAMTGSYLHYPIELALLTFLLLGMFASSRRWFYLVTAVIGMGAVLLSQGRSGIVLVAIGLAFGLAFARGVGRRIRIVVVALLAGISVLLLFPQNSVIDRILSIGVVEGNVNELRVNIWGSVLELWSKTPLLFGVHTGEYTNVTSRLTDAENAGVTESGPLDLLINFGLLGLVGFYGLMLIAALSAPRRSWYQAGLLAGIVQSTFYQSVEVFPFMLIFAMMPMLGRSFDADHADKSGAHALDIASTPPLVSRR